MPMNTLDEPLLSPPGSRLRRFIFPATLLTIALTAAGFYAGHSAESEAATPESGAGKPKRGGDGVPAVSVETVTQADFPVYLNGLGTVTALRTVTVRPRVDGELVRVVFSEGQMVKQGDLLAEIDPRPFQVQLQQAEGQLLRDEALLKNAELDHARYRTLLTQDSIAAQQVMAQESQVKQYRGSVEMDQAQVNNAKLQLGYAKLTSPISGRAGLRQIDQGNQVRAGDANGLVVITQLQPINVVFTLPEDKVQPLVQRLRSNQTIPVEAYDRAGKARLAVGKLLAIDNQIDPGTGTLKLKAQFDNSEGTLFANQFVNTKMLLETLHDAVQVSSAAVQYDSQGAFVYVVGPDAGVQQRRVTLGPSAADKVAVLSNLKAHEAVVVQGFDRLRDGGKADIAERDGQAVAASQESLLKTPVQPGKREQHS
ncbi:MdtA/MuxA family multidrug efflux RND transporter periplasmic adaptor subunit [Methylomicrobium sp. Wu6]|uniref:MdtA/MuxA family multidrug efflux RND transporter periplasmic adaptor subunit n=1 Tax=Methylomicrobium sp. Wu6 TaxID=3107928 RepID=UPI002DD6661C|nr:MdtA/MuxA family multidrug efflux RND transporter periplasmic adaptor subunit [Methylomicrobium sp. Wu6]MEC4747274.1 MdtA/MuxA family multidrug efflux RND transporter periplasmic adaptor subunit [Methylomicrobium sp. Wu6]